MSGVALNVGSLSRYGGRINSLSRAIKQVLPDMGTAWPYGLWATHGSRIDATWDTRPLTAPDTRVVNGVTVYSPHNMLLWSGDITNAAWTKSGAAAAASPGSFTVGANYAVDRISQVNNILPVGTAVAFTLTISGTPGAAVFISITEEGGAYASTYITPTLTGTPTEYTVTRAAGASSIANFSIRIGAWGTAATINVAEMRVCYSDPTAYVPTTAARRYLPFAGSPAPAAPLPGPCNNLTRAGLARRIGPTGLDEWGEHNFVKGSNSVGLWVSDAAGGSMVAGDGYQGRGTLILKTLAGAAYPYAYNDLGNFEAGDVIGIRFRVRRRAGTSGTVSFGLYNNSAFDVLDVRILSGPGTLGPGTVRQVSGLSLTEWTEVALTRRMAAAGSCRIYFYPDVPGITVAGEYVELHDIKATLGGVPSSEPVVTTTAARYLPRIAYSPTLDVNGQPYTITESYGAERISNGTFATNTTGWSLIGAGGALAAVAGELEITGSGGGYPGARQTLTGLTVGATYRLTCVARRGTTAQNLTVFGGSSSVTVSNTATTPVSFFFVASAASVNVEVIINAGTASGTAYVDDISVKEFLGVVPSAQPMCLGLQVEGAATNRFPTKLAGIWYGSNVTAFDNAAIGADGLPSMGLLTVQTTAFTFTNKLVQTLPHPTGVETHTFAIKAGTINSCDFGIYDTGNSWSWTSGSARIVRGPGTLTQKTGALHSITGLSTSQITYVEITRYGFSATGEAYFFLYPKDNGGAPAGGTLYFQPMNAVAAAQATSFIPNPTTSPAIRARDACVLTGDDLAAAFPAGFLRGTVVVRFRGAGTYVNDHAVFALSNDVGNSTSTLLASMSGTTVYVFAWNTATSAAGLILDGSTVNRLAVSWDCVAGKVSVALNGGSAAERTTGVDFTGTGIAAFGLGTARSGSALYDNQGIAVDSCDTSRSGQYLTGAALQALTA